MRNNRVVGSLIIVLGLILIVDGAREEPVQWLRVIAGALLILAGVFRIFRPRPATPPAP
jgi:uncharacterized membrane protein